MTLGRSEDGPGWIAGHNLFRLAKRRLRLLRVCASEHQNSSIQLRTSASVNAFLAAFPRVPGPWSPPLLGSASTGNTARVCAALSKRIVLIDGNQLTQLMIRHCVGCRIEETLYIKKVDEELFE
jgi:restriction endonuclease Mrr